LKPEFVPDRDRTMTINTFPPAPAEPHPLLSLRLRITAAVAVFTILSASWFVTAEASRQAMHNAQASLAPGVAHVTLTDVVIVGRRDPADSVDAIAATDKSKGCAATTC
jgi:hypothetical protein